MSPTTLAYGQALDFIASHRAPLAKTPIGHNYRVWADVVGSVRPSTGIILPRTAFDRALADAAKQFDHQDLTNQLARGDTPLVSLAMGISHQIAASIMPVALSTIEICDEAGQGVRIDGQTMQAAYTLSGSFSAAHRAHAPRLSDAANRAVFGSSNNPAGHGHNYWVEIESRNPFSDQPTPWGALDHLNLSHDVPELHGRNAVTETVAELIARRSPAGSRVRLWESADLFAGFDAVSARYQFGRRYRFHAAHTLFDSAVSQAANLRQYGRCALSSPHGHAYTAFVVMAGMLDPITDTVYNLAELDATAGALLRSFDKTDWRQAMPELEAAPATAENVARVLWDRLASLLGPALIEFNLYETRYQRVQVKRGADG
jgi:6-pyruvoyltetrahydropterin/6-carboxytetrahydropterin synthase